MNRLILEESDFIAPGRCRITGRRFRQLVDVIKCPVGKVCKAGLLGGMRGTATVVSLSDNEIIFDTDLNEYSPEPSQVRLAVAMQRPQTFSKVLHIATTMGVKKILFFHSFKVEKSYWQSPRILPENFRSELIEALEQCGDTILPEISFCYRFKDFADTELPSFSDGTQMIFGAPGAEISPSHYAGKPVTLIVGPEGGLTAYEEERLTQLGAQGVTLGSRILRTEYALAALLGKIS